MVNSLGIWFALEGCPVAPGHATDEEEEDDDDDDNSEDEDDKIDVADVVNIVDVIFCVVLNASLVVTVMVASSFPSLL